MKTIFLVRHAKSSWKDMSLSDHDRPLNARGIRDAPRMANWLLANHPNIDKFISSTANRARSTAEVFLSTYENDESSLLLAKSLYHADEEELFAAIWANAEETSSIALFAHNPGITYFANKFKGGPDIDNVSTCGIVILKSNADRWENVSDDNTQVQSYVYPKKLFIDE